MRFLLTILFVVLANCAFAQVSANIFNGGDTLTISTEGAWNTELVISTTRSSRAIVYLKVVGASKGIYNFLKSEGVLEPVIVDGVITFPGLESPMLAKINGNLEKPITFVIRAEFPG